MRVGIVLVVASIAASSAAPLEKHKEYELVPRAIVDQPGDGSELIQPLHHMTTLDLILNYSLHDPLFWQEDVCQDKMRAETKA